MNGRNALPRAKWILTLAAVATALSCGEDATGPSEPPDQTAPIIVITTPTTSGTHLSNQPTTSVSGTASDNRALASVRWQAGAQSGTATGLTAWSIPDLTVPEGDTRLVVTAVDSAGNSASDTLDIRLKTSGPAVQIQAPTTLLSLRSKEAAITVSGVASDGLGVTRVLWSTDTGASGTATGTTSWSFQLTSLQEGETRLVVAAEDQLGNRGADTLRLTIDRTPPALKVTKPATSGTTVYENRIDLEGTAADPSGVANVTWASASSEGTAQGATQWTADAVPLVTGENTITLSAEDSLGNRGSVSLVVRYAPPAASLSVQPLAILTNRKEPVLVRMAVSPTYSATGEVSLKVVDGGGVPVQTLGRLYDDGNLQTHGDDIAGDGVFSGLAVIDRAQEATLRLQATFPATSGGAAIEARSGVVALSVFAPATGAQEARLTVVQDSAATKLVESLKGGGTAQAALQSATTFLAGAQGVESVTPLDRTSVLVEYESGLTGVLLLTQQDAEHGTTRGGWTELFDPVSREIAFRPAGSRAPGRPDTLRSATPSIPLSRQTRGATVWAGAAHTAAPLPADGDEEHLIGNNKVLIFAPYEAVFAPNNEGPYFVDIMEDSPLDFSVTYVKNQQATVSVLQGMTAYGTVLLSTHGAGGDLFLTGELASTAKNQAYQALRKAGQVYTVTQVISDGFLQAEVKAEVYGVNSSFVAGLGGTFPNSLILNSSCESTKTDALWNAFKGKGAATYLGYSESVLAGFAVKTMRQIFTGMAMDLKTAGEAFVPGQIDPGILWGFKSHDAEFQLRGDDKLKYSSTFRNGSFELPNLEAWSVNGDGRAIAKLGPLAPTSGSLMGIISTGLGYTTSSGSISQSFLLPSGAKSVSLSWNFLSEEFLEWIGSAYQDYFRIILTDADGKKHTLFSRSIDQIAAGYTLTRASPQIVFDKGDVYMTGWLSMEVPLSQWAGTFVTLTFEATDVGDSIFDSAILLDAIKIN